MKKKISRILGVVLTLVLLSSLAIVSAPVSASTQAWSTFATPSTGTGLVLDPGNEYTGPFAIDKDGTAIYAASNVGGGGAVLVKSTDGGRTWAALTGFTATIAGLPGTFTDIVCSSIDANTVYVTDGVTIWKSINGGTTWAPLSSLFGSLGLTPGLSNAGFIVSLDVGYLGTAPYIFAATSTFGGAGGGAYVCREAVWGMPWTNLLIDTDRPARWGFGTDVSEIVVDPTNFATTQMVMAVVSTGPYELVGVVLGTAVWSDTEAHSGTYSALLSDGGAAGSSSMVQVPVNMLLADITDLSFWFNYNNPGISDDYIPALSLWIDTTGDGDHDYHACVTMTAGDVKYGDTFTEGVWQNWTLDTVVTTSTPAGTSPIWHTNTPASGLSFADVVTAAGAGARVLSINVGEGGWGTGTWTASTAYVDDIEINGVTYDLEPFQTLVTTKYGGAQWGTIANDVSLPGVTSSLYSASLWLPDDFNSNLASGLMRAFVGVDPIAAEQGDAFLALFGVAPSNAFDLNVSGGVAATHVSGLDGVGSAAGASLLASGSTQAALTVPRVFRSSPGGFTWLGDTKSLPAGAPSITGGASPLLSSRALPSILMLDSTTALVGTHGNDCGVSITNDYGATWNGISLLNATITSIDDLELGSFFMTTSGANDAVWRHDGTNWERVFSGSIFAPATTSFLVQQSPAGDAVFVADLGGTNIYRSMDNGQTWMLQVNNITSANPSPPLNGVISSIAVIDANTMVVSDGTNANTVYTTTTNGGYWFTNVCGVGTVQTLVRDAGTGDLLAGGTTNIRRSQNNGFSWSAAGTPLGASITSTSLAFSSDYAANETIYATGTDANTIAGVWKYDFSAATWIQIDGDGVAPPAVGEGTVADGTGLVAAPAITGVDNAEMVYASDATAGAGVSRIRQPWTVAEQMADASTFMGLWYEPGSNKLYTVDTTGPRIRTYTDTLNRSGTGVAVSAITTITATVSWNDLLNATTYRVVVNTTAQTNFDTAVSSANVTVGVNDALNTAAITGLLSGVTYNVSVWAATPVSSYLFDAAVETFTTLPTPPVPAIGLVPAHGAINIPILGPAFAWAAPAVPGITGYNFELTTDPTFATITVGTASPAEPYLVWDGALEYETAYYWRVRAVTAAGTSAWVTSVFTTVAEPEPPVTIEPQPTPTITVILPTPTVTVVPPDIDVTVIPPDITVDIPQPTITTVHTTIEMPEEVTPMYIWAIVAIGALLVIAVIILIIRTRRVV